VQIDSLQELYVEELRDIYNAEQQILKALPRMSKAASHRELQRAFNQHEKVTQKQVQRLERIFKELGESPRGKRCKGMEGLIDEGQDLIKEKPEPDVLDAGLISAAQRVEHYEIAAYGTVRTWARQLGLDRQAELLQQTLDEEGETDKKLTDLAESTINIEAEEEGAAATSARTGMRGTAGMGMRSIAGGRSRSIAGAGSRGATRTGSRMAAGGPRDTEDTAVD
jgi:ferritin-like metal-binding protein YciE